MSLASQVTALATRIGSEVKSVRTALGTLSALTTTDKSSLVAALNEVRAGAGGGADPWTKQVLAADYANSTVTASDVGLGFAPAANKRYLVEMYLPVLSAAATTGVQVALAGPTTGITTAAVLATSASGAATERVDNLSALNTFTVAAAGLATVTLLRVTALIVTGGSVGAGNVRLQARSEVAGSAVTVRAGAVLLYREV